MKTMKELNINEMEKVNGGAIEVRTDDKNETSMILDLNDPTSGHYFGIRV